MNSTSDSREDLALSPPEARESPLHGYQGDRLPPVVLQQLPAALTVAISREAGARGGTITRRSCNWPRLCLRWAPRAKWSLSAGEPGASCRLIPPCTCESLPPSPTASPT